MKNLKGKMILTVIILTVVVIIFGCTGLKKEEGDLYTPGSYEASAMGNFSEVPVTVTFSKNSITDIKVGENSETPGIGWTAFEKLTKEIIGGQTLAVDAVSGATNSSNAFLEAVAACVVLAGGNVAALKGRTVSKEAGEAVEKTVDVVIIGGGGAGLAAAVSASEYGATVILIEKASALGGNTLRAGGAYNACDPGRQKNVKMTEPLREDLEAFLEMEEGSSGSFAPVLTTLKNQINDYLASDSDVLFDSVELHMMQTYVGGKRTSLKGKEISGDVDLVRTLCGKALPAIEWLESLGMGFTDDIYTVLGALWPRTHSATTHVGAGYINSLSSVCEKNGVVIMLETRATHLIKQDDGRITGIKAEKSDGTPVTLHASRGVIMATGGYGANPEMIAKYNTYWPDIPKTMKTTNTSNATGDGIVMGEEAGAELTGMGFVQLMPSSHPETGALSGGLWGSAESQVFVNKSGKRFVNEYAERDVLASAALSQEDALFYIICDNATAGNPQAGDKNFWGDDVDTLIKTKSVYKGETLRDLEKQLGMAEGVLESEINKYNSYIEKGDDPDFGKKNFGPKLVEAPFYATPRSPSVHHTMGGLKIDTSARVLDKNNQPVPGFYAAGEVTGGIHAGNRLGGNAFADIMVFGKIAGASAAGEL